MRRRGRKQRSRSRMCRIRGRLRGRGHTDRSVAPRRLAGDAARRARVGAGRGRRARRPVGAIQGFSRRVRRRTRRLHADLGGDHHGRGARLGAGRAAADHRDAPLRFRGVRAGPLVGRRPIIEMRIFDFVMCAMDELVNQIAKVRYMFGGQAKPAVVIRMPHGMWRNSAAQHSQMLEAWFAHLPGVIVVTPATPADAAGLLAQAIRCDDPVLFFDPKDLFWTNGEISEPIEPIPLGAARKVAAGDAATVVTWSAAVPVATKAAEQLAAEGITVDLLDLRTIWPWDEAAVIASVKKTGRLLVVHEAVEVAGFGAEIVARVVDQVGPATIKAAKRLAAPRIPIPFAPPLEAEVRVTPEKVVKAVKGLIA